MSGMSSHWTGSFPTTREACVASMDTYPPDSTKTFAGGVAPGTNSGSRTSLAKPSPPVTVSFTVLLAVTLAQSTCTDARTSLVVPSSVPLASSTVTAAVSSLVIAYETALVPRLNTSTYGAGAVWYWLCCGNVGTAVLAATPVVSAWAL